ESRDFSSLSQDDRHQPFRQLPRAIEKRSAVIVRAKQLVRKAHGAGNPVRTAWSSAQEILPIKIGRPGFQRHAYIANPQGTPGAMPQCVDAEELEMILWSKNPYLLIS